MAGFFKYFPTTSYDANCGEANTTPSMISVTDLTKRFRVLPSLLTRTILFYTYDVMDGERPDVVAYKFYQNSQLDWLILMTNQTLDPFWDWPMGYENFITMVGAKYGSVDAASRGVHHNEQIIQAASVYTDGTNIPEQTVIIDYSAFLSLPSSQTRVVSDYEYEEQINNNRRTIKIIREEFLSQILNEAESILKT